eukprot:106363_1
MADDFPDQWIWISSYLGNMIGITIAGLIAVVHTKNVYSDLFTVERASISHRKYIPIISTSYKLIAVFVLASIYCYISNMMISLLSHHGFMFSWCHFVLVWATWHYNYAKMFMYLVFLIRLYVVYNESIHRYNGKVLLAMCIFVVCLSTTINCLVTFDAKPVPGYEGDPLIQDAAYCSFEMSLYLIPLIGLYDLGMSIVTAVLFIIPLKRSMKALHASVNSVVAKTLNVIIDVGRKNAILAGTAALTTFILMSLVGVGYSFISSIDFVVNIVCMVLMTPYYPRYYDRICCGVIQCTKVCCCCCCGRGITGETLSHMSPSVSEKSQNTENSANTFNTVTVTV